jgi:hypothetical protein
MVAYTYAMPSGIPGQVTRPDSFPTIEQQILDQTSPPLGFGLAVKMVTGKIQPINSSADVANSVYGVLVRPYPTSGNGTDGLGVGVPNNAFPADVLKKGYINVVCNGTAPVKNGNVFIRTQNAAAGKPVGGFEAALDAASTAAAHAGNTGNGAISAITSNAAVQNGVYNLRVSAAGTNAATFELSDPSGNIVDVQGYSGSGAVATFANTQLSFTVTDGSSDFVVGDSFQITAVVNTIQLANPNSYFTGGVDSSGNTEIAFKV